MCGTFSQHISSYNLACKPQLHVKSVALDKDGLDDKKYVCGKLSYLTKEIFI